MFCGAAEMTEQVNWADLESNADFTAFVQKSRQFDPVGFDRALAADKGDGGEFHRTIIEAYLEECASRMPVLQPEIPAFLRASKASSSTIS